MQEMQKGPRRRFAFSWEQGRRGPAGLWGSFQPCSCPGVLSPQSCCTGDGDTAEDENPGNPEC